MKKILLSLAPVPVETLKALVQRSPGVPDTDVIAGHDMSEEELGKAFAKRTPFSETIPSRIASGRSWWRRRDRLS